jgi:hypothetical protein
VKDFFMSMSDISWGAVLVGAAIAVGVVACAPQLGLVTIDAFAKGYAASYVYTGAAVGGGIAGEFVSDLLGRTGQAIKTIARG